jgi:uroporphyrinogen III methyltransferase/synthase
MQESSKGAGEKGNKKTGKVYLVGAGPGDPGLITLKGLKCIAKAHVLIYDRLISSHLLSYAHPEAWLIYAGKQPDRHTLAQGEINRLLVEWALKGYTVTRLKGGDPFLYGRGGEEAEFLSENNIPFEIVPGITSAIAAPAYAGIPVTHRNFTSSFAVITGHEDPSKNQGGIAWDKIATGIGTLVFLMGVGNLPFIVQKLVENGRSPATPAALIYRGTSPEQRAVTGCLGDIVERARSINFKHPAVIVVGEVAALRDKLRWFEDRPFFGKRIVVTRSREQAGVLAEKILELGGEPFEFPVIEILPPQNYAPLDRAIEQIHTYHWLIFTSVNGVKFFFERLRYHKRDIRDLKGLHLCAIGPRTRETLEEKGLLVEYVPPEYRAEAIIKGLAGVLKAGEKVLLPRAHMARKVLPEKLASLGAVVDSVETYRTVRGNGDVELLRQMLEKKMIHAIIFTSSSTVTNFVELLAGNGERGDYLQQMLEGVTLASIGPVTTETSRKEGLRIDVEASEYTIDGLLAALLAFFQSKPAQS